MAVTPNDISRARIWRSERRVLADNQDLVSFSDLRLLDRPQNLEEDLGFGPGGRRGLARPLNEAFADIGISVTGPEVGATTTTRTLFNLLFRKVLEAYPSWPTP